MNAFVVKARSLARRTGLIRLINHLRPERPYEDAFHRALEAAVKPGDAVWDVGANVGFYTELFCQWVGPEGQVIAFEPSVESLEKLRQRIPACPWLSLENVALGEADHSSIFVSTENSTTNHIETDIRNIPEGVEAVLIQVYCGDTVSERLARTPNVIKVDVEGFEEEVLEGMSHILTSPELRSVLVEVHFNVLELRGQALAPIRIEKILRSKGFQISWLDPSHLKAERPTSG